MSIKIFTVFRQWKGKKFYLTEKLFLLGGRCLSRYASNIDPLPIRYGGKTNITVLPGFGVGPEITERTLEVLEAAEAPLTYEFFKFDISDKNSGNEFEYALTSIRRNKVALKANIEVENQNPNVISRNILLRKSLDLYVYVLHCKTYPGLINKFGELDITVIRQNTEGEYLMLEHEPVKGSVESLKVITRFNSERIAEFAFQYALTNEKYHITIVHKADIQTLAEGLFLEAAKCVAKKYPLIKLDILEVSVAIFKLGSNPKFFDIILATNLNGSIVSNYVNGMVGGPGLSSGINLGENGIAVFEPGARNKGSSIVNKGIANPVAMMMAGINLLHYLGYEKTAETIQRSIYCTLVHDKVLTKDLGGKATTRDITDNIINQIKERLKSKNSKKEEQPLRHRWETYCQISEKQTPPSN